MNSSGKFDFRQFQEELAALDRQKATREPEKPEPAPAPPVERKKPGRPKKVDPKAEARAAFEAVRIRYELTVADVVSWFPEEEGIAYLQALIASAEPKPRKPRKKALPEGEAS